MSELDRHYLAAIQANLRESGEESLSHAYELGRHGLAQGLGLLDVISWYEEIVKALVVTAPESRRTTALAAVSNYFRELLSPFEMSFRGYQDNNRALSRLNDELSQANRELRGKQAQLVQAAKMASLGELVAGVAHEINNPLAFVQSHLSTAQNGLAKVKAEVESSLTAPTAEHLSRAQTRLHEAGVGLERIRDLVVKLRVFSRIDEGERKEVRISECIESVLTILRHKFEGRLEMTTHYGHPDTVDCYPSLLNQAIMNLIANGIDAIDGTGTISISTGADGAGYMILIGDTGRGIPIELRDRVFEPFFTTKPVGEGTGLGLSITYSIIQRHNGTLELEPRPGGGTLAIIRLPLDAGASD